MEGVAHVADSGAPDGRAVADASPPQPGSRWVLVGRAAPAAP